MKGNLFLKCLVIIALINLFLGYQVNLYADTIYLKNGDRISGEIAEESKGYIIIETEAAGSITIGKKFVERIATDEEIKEVEAEKKERLWHKELSIGYNKSSGNTRKDALSGRLYANRKTEEDEFTVKADAFYSSANSKMDAQKWYGMLRYAYSFWERKWYNFYKIEADHDRFANVHYRLVPSLGSGYWFFDREDWKAMVEIGVGFEHTDFKDDTKDSNQAVLAPRVFFERALFGKSRLSEDIRLYPSLENAGDYRLHSEAAFINPINDKLSLRFSLIEDYNSDSSKNVKKNDLSLVSSLVYSF